MIKKLIRYRVISDIHLGHKRNSTESIIHAINVWFDNYKPRKDLDIIFLAGDVFDQLLDFSSNEVSEITFWVHRFCEYCLRNNIRLRVLKGTPSHDWNQSKIFRDIHMSAYPEADIRYVENLSVEVFEDLGLSVLYVPDEWHNDTNETFRQAESIILSNNLSQVDIAIMHGNFTYQLPAQAIKIPKHNENDYLRIVKYFISIGHIHVKSVYERILAQGSFDRLAHGEEEPKGGMEITLHQDGTGEYFFIENQLAKIFKTITLKNKDLEQAIKQIERTIVKLPNDSRIRLRASKIHPAIIGFEEIKKRFPNCAFDKITLEEEEEILSAKLIDEKEVENFYTPITITNENIKALLMESINSKLELSGTQLKIVDKIFAEVL